MTPDDLARYIEEERTSPTALARDLGYSRASIYAMLADKVDIPLVVALALAALRAGLKPYGKK